MTGCQRWHPVRFFSTCEGIRAKLEMNHFARRALSSFHMEWRPRAHGRPEAASLPAGVRIIDAAVEPLGVEAHRIWDTQNHPLSVLEGEQPLRLVAGADRNVLAEAERVELVDPGVIAPLG